MAEVADVAIVLLAGVLGAVVLAVILLYKAHRKSRAIITQLNAEITAQKILALTQRGPTSLPAPEPEPARRKRHLGLIIGGGIAALLASLGDRARDVWHNQRAATVTVTAAASAVAAISAFALTSGDSAFPPAAVPSSRQPGPHTDTAEDARPVFEAADEDPGTAVTTPGGTDPALTPQSLLTAEAEARAEQPASTRRPTPATRDEEEEAEAGHQAPLPGEPSTPGPAPTTPAPPKPSPTAPAPSTPQPPDGPSAPPQQPDTCDGIGVKLPPLLELCLG